ncbi:MAG TPA: hypothetical protein VG273_23355, partial [Bryobacteraceae bacterium]|nr:hypothetical protein [Bryobacteraceae bacterium]
GNNLLDNSKAKGFFGFPDVVFRESRRSAVDHNLLKASATFDLKFPSIIPTRATQYSSDKRYQLRTVVPLPV